LHFIFKISLASGFLNLESHFGTHSLRLDAD
jgi:hypothetical protein